MAAKVLKPRLAARKLGKPSKFTEQRAKTIIRAVEKGATKRAAAGAAGIGYSTLMDWQRSYPEFSEALTLAEDKCAQRMATLVTTAGITDWRAAAWWLERRGSEEWAAKARAENIFEIELGRIAAERGITIEQVKADLERIQIERRRSLRAV